MKKNILYRYNVVMKNGMRYGIKTNESNAEIFIKKLTEPYSFNSYELSEMIHGANTVVINSNDVSSIEYVSEE